METSQIYARLASILKDMKEDKLHRRQSYGMVFDLLMDVLKDSENIEENGK